MSECAYKELNHGNAEIRIYRPELSKEERAKSEINIAAALQQYGRQIYETREAK